MLDKKLASSQQNAIIKTLRTDFLSFFSNNYPTHCPILRYALLDGVGNSLNNQNVVMQMQDYPQDAYIRVS